MKPTLIILAAGMGSRYGGLKQLDGVGPNGETILDYSVYDAIRGGFGKVVFVVRNHFRKEFEEKIAKKYHNHIEVDFVVQELDQLPYGFTLNPGREKPWGTAHAMLMAADVVNTPCAVINADDFYGKQSFEELGKFLAANTGEKGKYCMVGFFLNKTLSENGEVSRGICTVDSTNYLTTVEEHHKITEADGEISGIGMNGIRHNLPANAYASMNMWGFTPDIFPHTEKLFIDFLKKNENDPKKEFYIPFVVNNAIETGRCSVKVLSTSSNWFGVTFQEDRPSVVEKLKKMTEEGLYPSPLFE